MYENLLLSAGGGIVDRVLQCAQDDFAVLAIGLGGTGIDCLRILKWRVGERLRPDRSDGSASRYDHIRFLAVGTDKYAWGIPKKEYLNISCQDKLSDLFQKQRDSLADSPAYREWLQFDDIVLGGSYAVRQIGRFLLVRQAQQFMAKVGALVNEMAWDPAGNARYVCVHVFSDMGGGVGSGIFLDACYLVREALRRADIMDHAIMGHFFLPDVNLSRAGLPRQTKEYFRNNGYAAMQELDYCMGFGRNGDYWHQEYPDIGEVSSNLSPVDLCHLVSATTSSGTVIPNAYDHAMDVVANYVVDLLIRPDTQNVFVKLKSLLSPVSVNKVRVRRVSDAPSNNYLVIGAASAAVPYGRIMTYLATSTLHRLEVSGIRERVPSAAEVDQLLKNVGLTKDALLRQVQEGVDLNPEKLDVSLADEPDKCPDVEEFYTGLYARAADTLIQNLSDLSREISSRIYTDPSASKKNQTVMGKMTSAVYEAITDPKRGPWYAAALVRGDKGADLVAAVKSIKAWAEEKRNYEDVQVAQDGPVWKGFDEARKRFYEIKSLDPHLREYDTLVQKTCDLARCRIWGDSYDALAKYVDKLTVQLNLLADELTDPFRTVMGRLFDTFGDNWKYLAALADGKNSYETPVVTIREIAPQLDAELAANNYEVVSSVAEGLFERLLSDDGRRTWGTGDNEVRLARLVSDHFQEMFKDWATRSLTGYLENKYDIHNSPQKLSVAIYKDLLRDVDERSRPCFWPDGQHDTHDACAVGYVTVPRAESVVKEAAKMLATNDTRLTVRQTAVTDRISILRVLADVPMWDFRNIAQYDKECAHTPGTHLYERAVYVDGVSDPKMVATSRDWRELPSPTPRSKMGQGTDPEVRHRADETAGILDEALREGIVVREASGYVIRTISDDFMKSAKACHDAVTGRSDFQERLAKRDELRAMGAKRTYDPKKHLLLEALMPQDEGDELTICADLFAKAPILETIVRVELAKCHEIESYIKNLEL